MKSSCNETHKIKSCGEEELKFPHPLSGIEWLLVKFIEMKLKAVLYSGQSWFINILTRYWQGVKSFKEQFSFKYKNDYW